MRCWLVCLQLAADGFNKAAGAFLQRQAAEAEDAEAAGTDIEGNTHLHILAKENGNPDLVRGMIESGMNVNMENKSQDTPIHLAAKAGHVEVGP